MRQPTVGSVRVLDEQLLAVTLPPSFAGTLEFDYTIADATGATATAPVSVTGLSVFGPMLDAASSSKPIDSVGDVLSRIGTLFLGLLTIQLSRLQLGILVAGPALFLLLRLAFVRRDALVSVTSIQTGHTAAAVTGDTDHFDLRHDATIWLKGRKGRIQNGVRQVLVETPTGEAWVDAEQVTDTGY